MKDQTGLVRRGSIYYYRQRIPTDLLPHFDKAEVWRSLRTSNKAEAKQRAKLEALKWEQEFHQKRSLRETSEVTQINADELERLTAIYYAEQLEGDEYIRATGRLSGGVFESYGKALEKFDNEDGRRVAQGVSGERDQEMDAFLQNYGFRLSSGSEQYMLTAYAFAKARKRVGEAVLARQRGQVVDTPIPPAFALRVVSGSNEGDSLEALLNYWKTQGEKAHRTLLEASTAVRLFSESLQGIPASRITKVHVVAFKDKLLAEGKSPATVLKQVGLLKAIFETAAANGKLSGNPAQGVKVPRPKIEQKKRVSFSATDLSAIFNSPVFTQGARPLGGRGEAAYWIPLLGLWSGARLEEIGQLLTTNVEQEDGIHFLRITHDAEAGQTVKTPTSRRRVPLHPELIRLGFLDYVRNLEREGTLRLFPLLVSGASRQLTASWSQWWGRYLRKEVKITDSRKVFHSFRHGFKDACRDSDIPKELNDRLTGHGGGGVGDSYGADDYPLRPLTDAMNKLRYRGLDLAHLGK